MGQFQIFRDSEHWLQMTKKTVPKRTRWMPFIALKNNPVFIIVQSCCSMFPKEPALGSADQQITRLPWSRLNKSPTCTKFSLLERYQILQPHNVFRSGFSKLWVFLLCIRNTWNIPTSPCEKAAQQHPICSRELANKALLSVSTVKTILFSKEKDAGEVFLYHPCSAQIL